MEHLSQPKNVKDFFGARLNEKFPGFEDGWRELVKKVGDDFVNFVKDRIEDQYQLFKEITQFRISVVVDNNFVFGQIKNLVEKNKPLELSFLYRLTKLKSVKIYAPPLLVQELYDKIEKVLVGDKELARKYAALILEHIEVKDAFWINEWKKANNLIGQIDGDDVPYLALALEVGSHAIISRDAVFHTQGASKVWTIQETDKVVTNYHRGVISFCFLGTMPSILQLIWEVFMIIFRVIGQVLQGLIYALGALAAGSVALIGKIPGEVLLVLLGLGVLALACSENFRSAMGEAMIKMGELVKVCLESIGKFVAWIGELLIQIWEIFKPVGITTLEFAVFFMSEYSEMKIDVENLEAERAK